MYHLFDVTTAILHAHHYHGKPVCFFTFPLIDLDGKSHLKVHLSTLGAEAIQPVGRDNILLLLFFFSVLENDIKGPLLGIDFQDRVENGKAVIVFWVVLLGRIGNLFPLLHYFLAKENSMRKQKKKLT